MGKRVGAWLWEFLYIAQRACTENKSNKRGRYWLNRLIAKTEYQLSRGKNRWFAFMSSIDHGMISRTLRLDFLRKSSAI